MSFKHVVRIGPLRWGLQRLAFWRSAEKLDEIDRLLAPGDRVLDVGAGNGVLCRQLRRRGYYVVSVDVEDLSFFDDVQPVVYDGVALPFADDSFDVALLITVLHHTPDPDALLSEARRVARRVIVIEEIYDTALGKFSTFAIDSLFNLEFFGHPHTNRTDRGWRTTFQTLGLDVSAAAYSRSLRVLKRVTYSLARNPGGAGSARAGRIVA
ncbi:MAG TPA: class I SAM-dependent methyltransferase [Methylomirabilota bacterium]|jgi:ubiquinone/menaquinone biosynthesis C-methylase UbiE